MLVGAAEPSGLLIALAIGGLGADGVGGLLCGFLARTGGVLRRVSHRLGAFDDRFFDLVDCIESGLLQVLGHFLSGLF